ncbi:hypothetical protein ACHOLT_00170 [Desulfitobacterium sp. Sab5]|uniref:hypothetical protein n=1 Tax=Desulfitobacterium nosdiversum TaxID=3375356 RepID=UPI003CED0157
MVKGGNLIKKSFILTTVILLSISLILTACGTGKIKEPEINLKFNISDLTDEEFQSIGTKGLENATKSDFKNIEFALDVEQTNEVSNRKVIKPNLKEAANSYDRERYWFGESYSQDNQGENFTKYGSEFVFYSKGLEEQAIKTIFDSSEVRVSWTTNSGENKEHVFKLGEVIQFK